MRNRIPVTALLALLAAVPVAAQDSGSSLLQDLLQATRLPTVTREARGLGVSEQDVQSIFTTARERRMSAGSLAGLFSDENAAIRTHGRIDNFGAFVQEKLNSGLRGRELADAIRAEHARRGMGKGRASEAWKPKQYRGSSGSVVKPGNAGGRDDKAGSPGKSGKSGVSGESGKYGNKGGK